MADIEKSIYSSTIQRSLFKILRIRVSQINKCVFCIDYHSEETLKHSETAHRMYLLSAWQESPLFTDIEKSTLQLAEETTQISAHGYWMKPTRI
ncbi:carboxymuconolactone decarboxylase family protein [Pedobacter jamesrossensis]|uniref:Carboxymuconolactone decarboxylase family protein n=2 Tax=Pedobacter jamesrossensis TaxID=1908238 RepID=A0ABV8NIJ5_9SPHI